MKRGSTFFLRAVILFIGLVILAPCIFLLPDFASQAAKAFPKISFLKYPFLVCMYLASTLFIFALYQAFILLGYIDKGKAFSELSIKVLSNIKKSTIMTSILLYIAGMPAVYLVAEVDDAPGLILVGLVFTSVPLVIATFVAILQRLLQEAVDIKSENDFTV